ncbi:hypothetical protein TNCT_357591 [Trichonephila clavata]|uniref:Uncharacterized protein n=1 Tax=Trichonephila clavata TaxID=2740835 RepID=A0A8X6JN65_TRICU|nr:hypothetical protein TNCT_357591 [Trichonephila clavata]
MFISEITVLATIFVGDPMIHFQVNLNNTSGTLQSDAQIPPGGEPQVRLRRDEQLKTTHVINAFAITKTKALSS